MWDDNYYDDSEQTTNAAEKEVREAACNNRRKSLDSCGQIDLNVGYETRSDSIKLEQNKAT